MVVTTAMDHDTNNENIPSTEFLRLQKLVMLRKLRDLERCGVTLSQHYSIDNDFDEMKNEYIFQKHLLEMENTKK